MGKRIDLAHPSAQRYLADKGVDPTRLEPSLSNSGPADDETTQGEAAETRLGPDNIEDLLDLTFRDIAARYGTVPGFTDWLDARRKVADIRRLELRNAESEGRLIQRDFVRTHVFGYLNAVNLRLLRDTPRTLAQRVRALVRSDATTEELEAEIRERISSQLRNAKGLIARRLQAPQKDHQ